MASVCLRIVVKLALFSIAVFFIIFFVVHGYRYNKNVGFIQKNVFLNLKFWSDNGQVTLGGEKFTAQNRFLNLYYLDDGCYDMQYQDKTSKTCFDKNSSYDYVFVDYVDNKVINPEKTYCENVETFYHDLQCYKGRCFAEPIGSVFRYNDINFIKTEKNLYYCNDSLAQCEHLTSFSWDVVCANNKWIIYKDDMYHHLLLN